MKGSQQSMGQADLKHVGTEVPLSIDCFKAQSHQTWRVDAGKHEPQLIGQSLHTSNYKPIWP